MCFCTFKLRILDIQEEMVVYLSLDSGIDITNSFMYMYSRSMVVKNIERLISLAGKFT